MDLATVQAGSHLTHMALLTCWGFISDIDIDSEKLRVFGTDTRYLICSLKRIAQKNSYHGHLHYVPFEDKSGLTDCNDSGSKQLEKSADQSECKRQSSHNTASAEDRVCHTAGDTTSFESNKHTEGIPPPEEQNTSTNSRSLSRSMDTGSSTTGNTAACPSSLNNQATSRIPLHFLPPIAETKLPSNWKTIDGNFVLFAALMIPYVAHGFFGHPHVRIGSGYFSICYALDDIKRSELVSMFLTGETGEFVVTSEKIRMVKARVFRLEPLTPTGVITVDGEMIPYGPIQAEVHQNFIRVCSRKCIS